VRTSPFVIAVAVAALLAGCVPAEPAALPSATPTPSSTPAGDGVLRIGTLFPTSGASAFIAPAQAAGVALAVADINAAGGVGGVPVEIVARDSGEASAGTAEASFAELDAAGADVIIGPSSSVLAQRLAPLGAKAGIPLISPAATFPGLSDLSDSGYLFRTIPAYGAQGLALGEALRDGKKVGLLYIDDEFGKALAPQLEAGLTANGSTLVVSEAIPPGTTDLAPFIAALTAAAPDAVVLGSTYASIDATKALITATIGAGFGGAKLWLTTQNTGDYSQALPNGTLASVNGIIEGVEPDEALTARLKGVDPALASTRYSVEAYDATVLAALAAITARDDAGEAIAASLIDASRGGIKCTSFAECSQALKTQDDIDYDGLSGSVNFTPGGDVSSAYYGIYSYDGENRFVFGRGIVAG